MRIKSLNTEILIKSDLKTVWDFFSNPQNLKLITPPELKLQITSSTEPIIYPGQIISYTVQPFLGISMEWLTEITQVKYLSYFIDEQKIGPYKYWHHQHFFYETEQGVLVKDIVNYALPLYPLSDLLYYFNIKSKLENIFKYRELQVKEIFNN